MIIFLIIVIGILFLNMKVAPQGEFFNDYAGRKQTATINGIFTILIFFSHSAQYITFKGALDKPYLTMRGFLGQLVVASFLFFSGFGIMESISKKGMDYVKKIPQNRFFKVWYHFALSLIPFIILGFVFEKHYKISQILLAFTGYRSVGNSNWFMLATFAMYIIVFISFMICKMHKVLGIILTFALTGGFIFFEYKMGLETYYYNTILCFPAGMVFSMIKPYFDKFVMKNDLIWHITAGMTALMFIVARHFSTGNIAIYNAVAILLVMLLMILAMKIKIENQILDFFANHIFSFFILQRIPMIILSEIGYNKHKYSFIVISFICTVCITLIFDTLMGKTDKLIYARKKNKTN